MRWYFFPSDLMRLALCGSVAGVVRLTSRAWVWWQARGKERARTVAMGYCRERKGEFVLFQK